MKVRVCLYILLILSFLIVGKAEARAEKYAAVQDTCKVSTQLMMQPQTWSHIYQWVMNDHRMPGREEALTLIAYHFGNFEKLVSLLGYLDRGLPYAYLSEHHFPKLEKLKVLAQLKDTRIAKPTAAPPPRPAVSVPMHNMQPVPRPVVAKEKKREFEHKTELAIKNNLLYDLALAPNLEIELPIGRRWSLNTEYKCPWWSSGSKDFCYQLLSGGAEVRYWLGNRKKRDRLTGHFLGLYAEGGVYDFQFDEDKGYRGDYYGAGGLTYGYTHRLARHLALEFSLGIGYLTTDYRKYTTYRGDLIWQSSGRYHFVGPTKAKVSLVWLINARR